MVLARANPKILSSSCSPGFINTPLTAGMGAKLSAEEGTVSIRHLLNGLLQGNGWYYGSDAKRSPLHTMRNPGETIYNGPIGLKRVLVTGGNTGIGYALCRQLAGEHGCYVYLCSRSEDKGKAAIASILTRHPDAQIELLVLDVTSDESVKIAAASLKNKGVQLYGLV